jgi:hypothetical protein
MDKDKRSGKSSQNDKAIQFIATAFCLVLLIAIYLKVIFF